MVLVDGSNVARCESWRRQVGEGASDHDLRLRLVDAICSWAAGEGYEVQVAFDGAGPWRPGSVQASDLVEVIGTGAREGDDVVERLAADYRRADRTHWVVSSDQALRQVAGAGAERVVGADEFVTAVAAPPTGVDPERATGRAVQSRLSESLPEDVRARLERMRRGNA